MRAELVTGLKVGLPLLGLFISSLIARKYLQELSTRCSVTPFRVSILAVLFGGTVQIAGSIDLGAISFVTCLLVSVFIVYPAYVRDSYINEASEVATHLWSVLIILVVLIAGLSVFTEPSMIPAASGTTGIVISYVAIGLFSTLFGFLAMPRLVDESILETPDEDGEDDGEDGEDDGEDGEDDGEDGEDGEDDGEVK